MNESFRVPASPLLILAYYGAVFLVAGATAWSFRSGFMWTGICILAVAVPIGILYWYMLILNPGRARIEVTEEGLLIHAPPFIETAVPFASVQRVFETGLGRDNDLGLQKKPTKGMKFGSYRSGMFKTENGRETVVLANRNRAVCLDTGNRYVVLGPKDLAGLKKALKA